MMLVVAVILNYFGRAAVVASMGITAILAALVLLLYCVVAISHHASAFGDFFSVGGPTKAEAFNSVATFAMYNGMFIPELLYAVSGQEIRRPTFAARLFGGVFAVFTALLLHFCFIGNIDELIIYDLPTYWILKPIDIQLLATLYLAVLFATVVQSGVGVLQGLNERIDNSLFAGRGNGLHVYM